MELSIVYRRGTRDNKNINVMLSDDGYYYLDRVEKIKTEDEKYGLYSVNIEDDIRRINFINDKMGISGKRILDYGCGAGNLVKMLNCCGYDIDNKGFSKKPEGKFDIITMFHVIEHIENPTDELRKIKDMLSGFIVIETPNAADYLLKQRMESFDELYFWSEHLIVYTEEKLRLDLQNAGFNHIEFYPCQRYNIANHHKWLKEGKPGGHIGSNIPEYLNKAYEQYLFDIGQNDTLLVIAWEQTE